MLKALVITASLALAGAAFAQSTQPGQTTPSVTPSDTPAVTPSDTPSVIPPSTPPVIGGLSKCENMIGAEKDKCLQDERAAAAGAGGSHAPGSTGTGAGPMGPRNTAPAGSIR